MISIIVARSSNGVIGRQGGLPWRLPSDLRRFRDLTTGHAVVMGRTTFESIPAAYRPLLDRRNIVLSSDAGYHADGVEVCSNLAAALDACAGECFIIGGGITYRDALPLAQMVYATEIDASVEGDVSFPEMPESEWSCVEESEPLAENDHRFRFCVYERPN
jgi:dihydrofolate reductase